MDADVPRNEVRRATARGSTTTYRGPVPSEDPDKVPGDLADGLVKLRQVVGDCALVNRLYGELHGRLVDPAPGSQGELFGEL